MIKFGLYYYLYFLCRFFVYVSSSVIYFFNLNLINTYCKKITKLILFWTCSDKVLVLLKFRIWNYSRIPNYTEVAIPRPPRAVFIYLFYFSKRKEKSNFWYCFALTIIKCLFIFRTRENTHSCIRHTIPSFCKLYVQFWPILVHYSSYEKGWQKSLFILNGMQTNTTQHRPTPKFF